MVLMYWTKGVFLNLIQPQVMVLLLAYEKKMLFKNNSPLKLLQRREAFPIGFKKLLKSKYKLQFLFIILVIEGSGAGMMKGYISQVSNKGNQKKMSEIEALFF